jgi:transposase-like protein
MSKHRKSWSQPEKMAIINHYKEHGAAATSRQYDVSTGMIYRWVSQFNDKKESTATASKDLDYHRLLRENQALKEIVAEKELEIRVKDALLKKTTLNIKNG